MGYTEHKVEPGRICGIVRGVYHDYRHMASEPDTLILIQVKPWPYLKTAAEVEAVPLSLNQDGNYYMK